MKCFIVLLDYKLNEDPYFIEILFVPDSKEMPLHCTLPDSMSSIGREVFTVTQLIARLRPNALLLLFLLLYYYYFIGQFFMLGNKYILILICYL